MSAGNRRPIAETYGMSVDGKVYRTHLWKCIDCPFETSDRDAFFGHQDRIGWLGHNETHTMRVHPDVMRYTDAVTREYLGR